MCGPASESRENALIVVLTVKNRTSLNRRAGLTHCSEVSGYTRACAYVCVFIQATNNLGSFGTRWEGTFASDLTRKGAGALTSYACASMCTNKRHLIGKVCESSWGRKGGVGALEGFGGQACSLTHINEGVCAGVHAEFAQDLCEKCMFAQWVLPSCKHIFHKVEIFWSESLQTTSRVYLCTMIKCILILYFSSYSLWRVKKRCFKISILEKEGKKRLQRLKFCCTTSFYLVM